MKRLLCILIGVIVLMTALFCQTLSIQGVLRDNTGASVPDATKNFTFRLYTVATGGTKVWEETQPIGVVNGVYNATLGAVTTLAGLDYSVSYWMGISIDGAAEMAPRSKLTLSPYAIAGGVQGTTNVFPQSGNVGIGLTNPDRLLDIKNGSGAAGFGLRNKSDYGLRITTWGADNRCNIDPMAVNGHIHFGRDVAATGWYFETGNVGIGTSSPLFKLHVAGQIYALHGLKVPSACTVIQNSSNDRAIMTTGWISGIGDFTAIHSGYDHDASYEPVSVVAGGDGVRFTKATTAGTPYGETMMKVGRTDIDMQLPVKIDGNKPIIFKRFNCGQNQYTNTGYSYETYTVGVVGFKAADGDINEDGSGDIIQVYAYKDTDTKTWWLKTDFRTHLNAEEWTVVDIIIVNNKLCDLIGY